jgi:DNA-binding transcriptional regulator PaaX
MNMKMRPGKKIMYELLSKIEELADLLPSPLEGKSNYQKRLWKMMAGYPPTQVSKSLYYLQQKKHIKKKVVENQQIYELTISGRQKLLLSTIAKTKWKSSDGNSCIIVFDIPESKRRYRRFIRKLLLDNGFINLQKSVLIGPEFLSKDFFDILEEWKLRRHVTLIKGKVMYL